MKLSSSSVPGELSAVVDRLTKNGGTISGFGGVIGVGFRTVNMKDSYATFSAVPVHLFLQSTLTAAMGSIDPIPSDLLDLNGITNPQGIRERLPELFDENITAKILRTAVKHLEGNVSSLFKYMSIAYKSRTLLQSTPRSYPRTVATMASTNCETSTFGHAVFFLAAFIRFWNDSSSTLRV